LAFPGQHLADTTEGRALHLFIYIVAKRTTKLSHIAKLIRNGLKDVFCAREGAQILLFWSGTQIIGHGTGTTASPNAVSVLV